MIIKFINNAKKAYSSICEHSLIFERVLKKVLHRILKLDKWTIVQLLYKSC